MKKSLIILLLNIGTFACFSQNLPNFLDIPLKDSSDYKMAEKEVILAADFLLETTPYERKRGEAHQFLSRWMEGTPYYNFRVDETAAKIYEMNANLMGVYLAAMAKFTIENQNIIDNKEVIELATIQQLISYCKNSAHNIPIKGALKKMIKAHEKGELKKYVATLK